MYNVAAGIADAAVDFLDRVHEDRVAHANEENGGSGMFSSPITGRTADSSEHGSQHGNGAGHHARPETAPVEASGRRGRGQHSQSRSARPSSSGLSGSHRGALSPQHRDATLKSLAQSLALPSSDASSGRTSTHGNNRHVFSDDVASEASEQSVIAPEILDQLTADEIQLLLKAALEGGNFFDAKQLCLQRLNNFDRSIDAHVQFSQVLIKAGEPEAALEEAEEAISIDNNSPKGWLVKARACRALGQVAETFSAMMQCERLVAKRTAELKPKFDIAVEDTRRRKERQAELERKRRRRALRTAPEVPSERQLFHEYPWEPPQQCEALKTLQAMLQDVEQQRMHLDREMPGLISKLIDNLEKLGPRWWVLTKEDEVDPELLLPPPSKERTDLLDQILCRDLDSLLLAACVGAGPFTDISGKFQKEAKRLMSNLILDEGAAVLVREQMLQRVVMKNAGANLLPHLQTSKWQPSFTSPTQLHAVASVSAMAAFQHLFELYARAMAPLLRRPPNPEWLRTALGEEAEPWRRAVFMLKPWLDLHGHRLFNGVTQLLLHSILASVVQSRPDHNKDVGHDAHAFLFHIIKICSSKGVEAFFRRLAHPTGVAWLWDGYFARMRVYQTAYFEVHEAKELRAKEMQLRGIKPFASPDSSRASTARSPIKSRKSFRERFTRSVKKSRGLTVFDDLSISVDLDHSPGTSRSGAESPPQRNLFASEQEERPPMTATAVGSRSARIRGRMDNGIVGWGDGKDMDSSHLTSRSIRDKVDSSPEAQFKMGSFKHPATSPRGGNSSRLLSDAARPMTSPALGAAMSPILSSPMTPMTPMTPATPGGTILASYKQSPVGGRGQMMTPEPSPAGGRDAALRTATWSFRIAGAQRATLRRGGTPVAEHVQRAALAFRKQTEKNLRLPSEDKPPVTNWWDPQVPEQQSRKHADYDE